MNNIEIRKIECVFSLQKDISFAMVARKIVLKNSLKTLKHCSWKLLYRNTLRVSSLPNARDVMNRLRGNAVIFSLFHGLAQHTASFIMFLE